ncbi:MAG: hypothetical protein JWM93_136 [Frankiales bacterium]|nr:hypothetical protein [Frankiales bacterium]
MRWRQGPNQFGLLIAMSRLVRQAGDVSQLAPYLKLAVDEPHVPSPDGSRVWFFDLPSGPY